MANDVYIIGTSRKYELGFQFSAPKNFTRLNLTLGSMDRIAVSGVSFVIYTSATPIVPDPPTPVPDPTPEPIFIDTPPTYDPIIEPEVEPTTDGLYIVYIMCGVFAGVAVIEVLGMIVTVNSIKKRLNMLAPPPK